MTPRGPEAGFTLMEVIIALWLMALISLAGLGLMKGMLATGGAAEGRLERLAELQRAMFLLTDDFTQIADGPLIATPAGVAFNRDSSGPVLERRPVAYRLVDGVLRRDVGSLSQQLMTGVDSVSWSYYDRRTGWASTWPPNGEARTDWPAAVAVDISLAAEPRRPGGTLRRVVELPTRPAP